MNDLLVIAGLFLIALGLVLGGLPARVCHILAAVAFGVALLDQAVTTL